MRKKLAFAIAFVVALLVGIAVAVAASTSVTVTADNATCAADGGTATTCAPTYTVAPGHSLTLSSAAPSTPTCDRYASTQGSDANNGSSSAPFATPQKLIDSLSPGQTGCLKAGTYTQDVTATTSGTSTAPVTVMSDPAGGTARIVGRLVVLGNYETWTHLNLDGYSSAQNSCGTIDCNNPGLTINGTGDQFTWNDIHNENAAICVQISKWNGRVGTDTVLAHNKIHQCGVRPPINHEHCVYDSGNNVTIQYNLIYNCADRAVQFYPGPQGAMVAYNVIDDDSQGVDFSGDTTTAPTTGVTVQNNIITNAGLNMCNIAGNCYGLGSWWGGAVGTANVAKNNCLYNNADGDITGSGYTSSGNLVANPQYASQWNRDYNIPSTSPCYPLTGNIAGLGQGP